jgi:hypothetical protein
MGKVKDYRDGLKEWLNRRICKDCGGDQNVGPDRICAECSRCRAQIPPEVPDPDWDAWLKPVIDLYADAGYRIAAESASLFSRDGIRLLS